MMTAFMLGSAALQVPIGRACRIAMIGAPSSSASASCRRFSRSRWRASAARCAHRALRLAFALGSVVSTQYYVAAAHAVDRTGSENAVTTTSALLVPLQHRCDLWAADRLLCDDFIRTGGALRLHGPSSSVASRLHLAPDALSRAAHLALGRRAHAATLSEGPAQRRSSDPHLPSPFQGRRRKGSRQFTVRLTEQRWSPSIHHPPARGGMRRESRGETGKRSRRAFPLGQSHEKPQKEACVDQPELPHEAPRRDGNFPHDASIGNAIDAVEQVRHHAGVVRHDGHALADARLLGRLREIHDAVLLVEAHDPRLRIFHDHAVIGKAQEIGGQRLRSGIEDGAVRGRARHHGRDDAQRRVVERADAGGRRWRDRCRYKCRADARSKARARAHGTCRACRRRSPSSPRAPSA